MFELHHDLDHCEDHGPLATACCLDALYRKADRIAARWSRQLAANGEGTAGTELRLTVLQVDEDGINWAGTITYLPGVPPADDVDLAIWP